MHPLYQTHTRRNERPPSAEETWRSVIVEEPEQV